MQKMKLLLLLLVSFTLTGCFESFKKKEYIVETSYVLVQPDNLLLKDCPEEPPPGLEEYREMGISEREYALITHNAALIRNIRNCNKDKQGIREQIESQKKIIEENNLKEKERVKKLRD